jgi:RNA polymerase sigma factor (sigma-70 family)
MASFAEFLEQVRLGDEDAANQFVAAYEPHVRRIVRRGLKHRHPQLRRYLDSVDLCQSMFKDFFKRLRGGQIKPATPTEAEKLLTRMILDKLTNQYKRQMAARRDIRRLFPIAVENLDPPASLPSPCDQAVRAESLAMLQEAVSQWLTCDEQSLLQQRMAGRSWLDIAGECGRTPDSVRMQFVRAMRHLADQLRMRERP